MNNKAKGIAFVCSAAAGFSLMSAFVRLAGDLPPFEKAFFRNFVALVVITGVMMRQRIGIMPERGNMKFVLCRAAFGTVGLLCNFYAIDHLLLSDANMLNKLSPFFAILFSVVLLKEKPRPVQLVGVALAFVGAMFILDPAFADTELFPALIGICGGAGAGIAYTFVRKLGLRGENSSRIIFWFSLISCLSCIPFIIFDHAPISPVQAIYLFLAGMAACLGQFGITKAYVYAPAREISVYDYTQVIFAAILGFLLFGQVPDFMSIIGYLLICGAGVGMFLYNRARP